MFKFERDIPFLSIIILHFSILFTFLYFYFLSLLHSVLTSCNVFVLLEVRNTKHARRNVHRMLITEIESGFLEHFFLQKEENEGDRILHK